MIAPPRSASPSPANAPDDNRSFRKNGETNATHSGPVLTSTTELATVVYSSDVIHVAKCSPRNNPEATPKSSSLRVSAAS